MALLTEQDQKDLKEQLENMRALGSNSDWVTQAIEDVREKNAAGGYATRVHAHPGGAGGLSHADVVAIVNGSQIVAPT